jgi:RES domain
VVLLEPAVRAPGAFRSADPGGSCYLSDRMSGAWLEVFRSAGLVDREDVERRRLVTASRSGAAVKVANLRAPQARPFGVTNDLVAGDDYARPQAWAAALRACGFKGLLATARHDPTAAARNVALFGRAGARTRLSGWRTKWGH